MALEEFQPLEPLPSPARRKSSDTWNSLKIGLEQLPGTATGLLDLPSAAVFGTRPFEQITSAVGEATGFEPGRWAQENERTGYSPKYWQQQRAVGRVWDENVNSQEGLAQEVWDIIRSSPELAAAYAKNPSYTWNQVVQSLPSMLGGGVAARGLMGAGARVVGGETVGALERTVGTKWASPIAAGVGEGSVTAGQIASQSMDALGPDATPEQIQRAAIASGTAGLATGGIGMAGGRLAQRFGLETPETLIAGGRRVAGGPELPMWKRVGGGAVSEGVLQEFPQSISEGGFQNVAEGRGFTDSGPGGQGLIRQGIEGGLAGGLMGGGANVLPGRRAPTPADLANRDALSQGKPVDLLAPPAPSPTQQPRLPFDDEGYGTSGSGVARMDARVGAERDAMQTPDAAEIYRSVVENPQLYTPEQVGIAQEALVRLGFQPRQMPGIPEASPQRDLFPAAPRPALGPAGEGTQLGFPEQIEGNDVTTGGAVNPYTVGQRGAMTAGQEPGTAADLFTGQPRPVIDKPLPEGVTSRFVQALGRGDLAGAEKVGAQAAMAGGELQRFYGLVEQVANPVDAEGQRQLFHPNREAILEEIYGIVQRGEKAMGEQKLGTPSPQSSLPVRQPPMADAARKALFSKAMGGKENLKLLDKLELAGRTIFQAASAKLEKLRKSKKATKPLIEQTQTQLAELEKQYNDALAKKQYGKLIALQKQAELVDAQTGEAIEGMSAELPTEIPAELDRQKELRGKAVELWRRGLLTDRQVEEVAAHLSGDKPHYERAEKIIKPAIAEQERALGDKQAKLSRDLSNIREEQTDSREKAAVKETVDLHVRSLMKAHEAGGSKERVNVRRQLAMLMNIARYNYGARDKWLEEDGRLGMIDELRTAEHAKQEIDRLKEAGALPTSDMIAAQNASHRMDEGAGRDIGGFTEASDRKVKAFLAALPKTDDRSSTASDYFGEQDPMSILNKAALRLSRDKDGEFQDRYETDHEVKFNKETGKEEKVVTRKAVDKLIRDILGEFDLYKQRFGEMNDLEHVSQISEMAERYGADVMEVMARYMETSPMTRHARVEFAHPDFWASGKFGSDRVSGKATLNPAVKQRLDVVAGLVLVLDKDTGNQKIDTRREQLKEKLLKIYSDTALRGTDKHKMPFPEFVMMLLTNAPGTKIYTGTSPDGKAANTAAMVLRFDLLDAKKDKTLAQWAKNVAALKVEELAREKAKKEAAEAARPAGTKAEVETGDTESRVRAGQGQTYVELPDGTIENYEVKGEVVEDEHGLLMITDLEVRNADKDFDDPAFADLNDLPAVEVFKEFGRRGLKGADVDALKNQADAIRAKNAAEKNKAAAVREMQRESVQVGEEKLLKNTAEWIKEVGKMWESLKPTPAIQRVLYWLKGSPRSHTLARAKLAARDLQMKFEPTEAAEIAVRRILLKLEQRAEARERDMESARVEARRAKPLSKTREASMAKERAAELEAIGAPIFTEDGKLLLGRNEQGKVVPKRSVMPPLTEDREAPLPKSNVAPSREAARDNRKAAEEAAVERVRLERGEKQAMEWLAGDEELHTVGRARVIAASFGITPIKNATVESIRKQIEAKLERLHRERRGGRSDRPNTKKWIREEEKQLRATEREDAKARGPLVEVVEMLADATNFKLAAALKKAKTVGEAIEAAFSMPNITPTERVVLEHLAALPDVRGIRFTYGEDSLVGKFSSGGYYQFNTRSGSLDESVNLNRLSSIQILIHEISHAATMLGIDAHISLDENTGEYTADDAVGRELLDLFAAAKRATPTSAFEYGFTDPFEFIAEAEANPTFQSVLKATPYTQNGQKTNLLQAVLNWIKRLLRIPAAGRTAFDAAMDLSTRFKEDTPIARGIEQRSVGSARANAPSVINPLGFMPSAVRGAFAGPVAQVKAAFNGAVHLFAPIRDVFESMQRAGIKTVSEFARAYERRMAMQRQKEQEAERIGQGFQKLRYTDQMKVSKFLGDATLKGWGYQPTWLRDESGNQIPVGVNSEMKQRWAELADPDGAQSEMQRIVDRVFQFNDDMWRLKQELVNQAIRDKYEVERAAANGDPKKLQQADRDEKAEIAKYGKHLPRMIDKPYAPLKRFGKFAVVGKSGEFAALEQEYESGAITKDRRAEVETQLRAMKANPKHYEVRFEANAWAVENAITDMKRGSSFASVYSMERTMLAESQQYELPYHVLSRLKSEIDELGLDPKATNSLQRAASTLYVEMLSQENARKNELERLGVPGYGEMMQAFISQARSDASLVSTLTNNRSILQALRAMRKEVHQGSTNAQRRTRSELYNEVVMRYLNTTHYDDSTVQQKMMRFNSVMLLITSPAYLMQNATQVGMMTLPKLAANYGWGRAAAHIADTYLKLGRDAVQEAVDFKSIKDKFGADTASALAELQDAGKIDITIMQEIGQWARTGIMPKSAFGRWIKENDITAATGRGLSLAASLPQRVEMMNRMVTGISAYQMKKEELDKRGKAAGVSDTDFAKQNHDKAVAFASKMIDESQGAYDEASVGRIFQQGSSRFPVKLLLQFRKFQVIQLSFMIRDFVRVYSRGKPENLTAAEWREEKAVAKRALAFAIAHYGAMTGLLGIPFVGMVMGAFAALGAGGDDDDEPRPSLLAATPFATAEDRQLTDLWLRRQLGGGTLATLLTRGVPNLVGLDLSSSIGAGAAANIFPYAKRGKTAVETLSNQVMAGLGATAGTGQRLARGYDFMAQGDFHRGLEQMLPSGVGNAMQGLREGLGEGKVDKSGTVLTPAEDISAWRTTLKSLGLKTTADSEQNLLQQKVILTEQHYADMRKDIGQDYVAAKRDGDAEKAGDARQRWIRMAASMRTQGMKAPTLTDLNGYWTREVRDQRQVVGGVVVKRADRALAGGGI